MRSHIQAWSCCVAALREPAAGGLRVAKARHGLPERRPGPRPSAHSAAAPAAASARRVRWSAWPCGRSRRSALVICARARVAAASSRSALLMTTRSASSITPFLMACRSSPALGNCMQHEHVGHAGDRGLALAHADGLDDHDVEAGGLAHQHRFARLLGHAAQRAAGRAGADVGALVHDSRSMRVLSPRIEPPQTLERRVHRQHGHAVAAFDQEQAQRLDEGALAHAGHAADAQAEGTAAVPAAAHSAIRRRARGGRRAWIRAA